MLVLQYNGYSSCPMVTKKGFCVLAESLYNKLTSCNVIRGAVLCDGCLERGCACLTVQRLQLLSHGDEEGLLCARRVRLRRQSDGDVSVQPGGTSTVGVLHEGDGHADTLLVPARQVRHR